MFTSKMILLLILKVNYKEVGELDVVCAELRVLLLVVLRSVVVRAFILLVQSRFINVVGTL